MKKAAITGLVFFVAGIAIATLIVANPLDWRWAGAVQARLAIRAPDRNMGAAAANSAPQPAHERHILYWRAPMDPTYISDKPGKSPMGMDLIPVYEDEMSESPGVVNIDPGFVQKIGVQSVAVERTDIPHTIRTVGTFKYDDSQVHSINTKFEGWIEKAQVNYIGQEVEAGQRLFDIFSPQLVSTQEEYIQAVQYVERLSNSGYPEVVARAQSLVEAARQRLRYWDITDSQIDALVSSGKPRRTLTVVSPVNGIVISKMDQALDGMLARPGMNLYKIADLSTIWVDAEIYEDEIPWLRVGQRARIDVPNQPGRHYTGTIRYIYPFLNQSTRTLKLSIEMPNPRRSLRADMYADITLDVPSARGVLAVPEEAVLRSGQRDVVVLDVGGGTFQVRVVTLGIHGNGLWEVRDGLFEGNRVVVSSQFLIDSESNLREAIRKLTAAPLPVEASSSGMESDGMDMENTKAPTPAH